MNLSKIAHWVLRMFVYACMGTSAMLLVYNFQYGCWFCEAGKNNQAEAKTYIGSMNRSQQAHYLENGNFSNSINNLGLAIKKDTNSYSYRILSPMNPVQNLEELKPSPLDEERAIAFATPKKPGLKSYIGIVLSMGNGKPTTNRVVCEWEGNGNLYPSLLPTIFNNQISCPPGLKLR